MSRLFLVCAFLLVACVSGASVSPKLAAIHARVYDDAPTRFSDYKFPQTVTITFEAGFAIEPALTAVGLAASAITARNPWGPNSITVTVANADQMMQLTRREGIRGVTSTATTPDPFFPEVAPRPVAAPDSQVAETPLTFPGDFTIFYEKLPFDINATLRAANLPESAILARAPFGELTTNVRIGNADQMAAIARVEGILSILPVDAAAAPAPRAATPAPAPTQRRN